MSRSLLVGRKVNFTGFSANKYRVYIGKKEILCLMSLCGEYVLPILQQQEMEKRNKKKKKTIPLSKVSSSKVQQIKKIEETELSCSSSGGYPPSHLPYERERQKHSKLEFTEALLVVS